MPYPKSRKYGTMRCRTCEKTIRYKIRPKYVERDGLDPNRLIATRRHYSREHPRVWRESVRRGARKRGIFHKMYK